MEKLHFVTDTSLKSEDAIWMTISENGKIGIGKEVPSYDLDVSGSVNVSGDIKFGRLRDFDDIGNNDPLNNQGLIWDGVSSLWVPGINSNWNKDGNNIYHNQGNVAVGLDTPGSWSDGTNTHYFTHDVSGHVHVSQELHVDGKVGIGIIPQYNLHVNGTALVSTNWTTSDDRIKHNEVVVQNALSTILKLNPTHYLKTTKMYDASHNFAVDPSGFYINSLGKRLLENVDYYQETGIIAQRILEIPELKYTVRVSENNNVPMTVDYNSIHCTHLTATKELNEKFKLLTDINNKLKAKNTSFKQNIIEIKQHIASL